MNNAHNDSATMIAVACFIEGKPFTTEERAASLATIGEVRDFAALGRAAYLAMLRTEVARLRMRRADAMQEIRELIGCPAAGLQ